jgi:hypothetical protein
MATTTVVDAARRALGQAGTAASEAATSSWTGVRQRCGSWVAPHNGHAVADDPREVYLNFNSYKPVGA